MGKRYLIDSNVIIDYTALRLPEKGSDFVENLFDTDFLISVATKIEVLGFNDVPEKLVAMEEFVNSATTLSLDELVTKQTINLRREYKKLKLGDAIIAATALVHNLIVISRNVSDFKNITGLQVVDPHSL
jgi:predicted nucleic acid-binding protein